MIILSDQKRSALRQVLQGKVLVFLGETGVGKGGTISVLHGLNLGLEVVESVTTRQPRSLDSSITEQYYQFCNETEFQHMIDNHEMAWWISFSGNWYGTRKSALQQTAQAKHGWIIDVTNDTIPPLLEFVPHPIFFCIRRPADEQVWQQRLTARGETAESVAQRLEDYQRTSHLLNEVVPTNHFICNDVVDPSGLPYPVAEAILNQVLLDAGYSAD